jgi:hypothetical protein
LVARRAEQGEIDFRSPRVAQTYALWGIFQALGASWSGKGITLGSYEESGTEAKESENGPMRKFRLRGLLQDDAQLAQVLFRPMFSSRLFRAAAGQGKNSIGSVPSLRARISHTDDGDRMRSNGHNSALSPQLKSWIDRVIVPALVREYVARLEPENSLATSAEPTVDSVAAHAAIAEGER